MKLKLKTRMKPGKPYYFKIVSELEQTEIKNKIRYKTKQNLSIKVILL